MLKFLFIQYEMTLDSYKYLQSLFNPIAIALFDERHFQFSVERTIIKPFQ